MEEIAEELAEPLRQRAVEAEAPLDLLDDVERRLRAGDGAGRIVRARRRRGRTSPG